MSACIAIERADHPDIATLLDASDAFSAALYPPQSRHGSPLDALLLPHVTFLVARLSGEPVGCGALFRNANRTGELKRMFVDPSTRGRGVGKTLLAALETEAARRGIVMVRLETGVHSLAALALYRGAQYVERGPFGHYQADPLSVFMEKRL